MWVLKKKHWKCSPAELRTGPYTRLLAAFCKLKNLKFEVNWHDTNFGLGVEVAAVCQMPYNEKDESILCVRKEGQIVYVGDSREYTQDADKDTVEKFSRKILEEFVGENKTIESFKGGDGFTFKNGKLIPANKLYIKPPQSIEELRLMVDLAGIDMNSYRIQLKHSLN